MFTGCSFYQIYHEKPLASINFSDDSSFEKTTYTGTNAFVKDMRMRVFDGITPTEAAILAILYNPTLKAVRKECDLAQAQVVDAWILPNPVVVSSIEPAYEKSEDEKQVDYGIGIEWEVTSIVPLVPRVRAAYAQKESVRLNVAWLELQTAKEAKQKIYKILSLEEQKIFAEETVNILKSAYADMLKAKEAEEITAVDLANMEIEVIGAQNTLQDLEQEITLERIDLQNFLGMGHETEIHLENDEKLPLNFSVVNAQLSGILKNIASNRYDLLALEKMYESQEQTYRSEIYGQLPATSVGAIHHRDSFEVAISMDLPVFDRNQGAIATEKANREKMFYEYHEQLLAAKAEVMKTMSSINAAYRKLASAEKLDAIHTKLVETHQTALNEKEIDVLEYNEVKIASLEQKIELSAAKEELASLLVELEYISGMPIN